MDRFFGTNEPKETVESGWGTRSSKLSYNYFHDLPDLLVELLSMGSECVESDSSEDGIFKAKSDSFAVGVLMPAMEILRRAGPPDRHHVLIRQHLVTNLGSNLWHIRDLAARTFSVFVDDIDLVDAVNDLLGNCLESLNALHGSLLATKYLIQRNLKDEASVSHCRCTGDLLNVTSFS